jgi:hypothetical protein
MTKKELSNLYWLNKEIKLQEQRLDELTTSAEGITSIITGMPHSKTLRDKVASNAVEIAELRRLIELNLKKCFIERARIERYIGSVGDCSVRVILQLRHIEGLSWDQIGKQIGFDGSTVRKKYERYLKISQNSRSICDIM